MPARMRSDAQAPTMAPGRRRAAVAAAQTSSGRSRGEVVDILAAVRLLGQLLARPARGDRGAQDLHLPRRSR